MNGNILDFDKYKNAITAGRAKNHFSLKSTRELLVVHSDTQGVSHLAQEATFVAEDKNTGVKTETRSVILASISEKDGKRLLTGLDEITT